MNRTVHRIIAFLNVALLAAGLAGCYPDESGTLLNLDVVLTRYDSAFHFGAVHTYIMPDTVVAFTDTSNPANNTTYNHTYDSLILAETAYRLNLLGYERLWDTLTVKPDVGITVNVIATVSQGTFPTWYSAYDFSTGTLVIHMADLKPPVPLPADSVHVVWLGAVNGVAEGSDIGPRIKSGIDQMFHQSPYL
jgi:hypothetical protein